MKPIIPFALLGALLAVGAAKAAVTDPVGYVTLGDTTIGQPSIKGNTDVAASIPLLRTSEFTGTVSLISGSDITISGTPGFTASPAAGSFAPTSGVPYIIQVDSGAKAGLIALVTANTTGVLTVSTQTGDSLTGILAGDQLSVREAWTVSNLFEGSPVPAGTQVLAFSGTVPGVNLAADLIYEFDGTDWIDTNSFDVANNVVLYPSESFIIRNVGATPIASISVTGDANTTNARTVLPASGVQQDIPFSFFGSGSEVIGTSGLSAISTSGDQILLSDNNLAGVNKAGTTIIEYDGAAWIDTNSFDDVTLTFKLEAGAGYFLRSAASGDRVFSNVPDYVPGL